MDLTLTDEIMNVKNQRIYIEDLYLVGRWLNMPRTPRQEGRGIMVSIELKHVTTWYQKDS